MSLSKTILPFTVGAIVYGVTRAYNDVQQSPTTYIGITMGMAAIHSSFMSLASSTRAGLAAELISVVGAAAYTGITQYAAIKAGEQIGHARQQTISVQSPDTPENRELR